jgi:phenylacetate-coenzyme A ligase PaaK-like adenylate-forming protein
MDRKQLAGSIFDVDAKTFDELSLAVFRYQYDNNLVYREFCNLLSKTTGNVRSIEDIPFLPIELFKTHTIVSGNDPTQKIFRSSGTTGSVNSCHYVSDLTLYEESFSRCFNLFFGPAEKYCLLALLPSYLERNDASLVYMIEHLIRQTKQPDSGFFLHNHDDLKNTLGRLDAMGQNVLLIGVTFALLDFVEKYPLQLKHTLVMETGGMKGRRREMIREELHKKLQDGFGTDNIYSEYGMTELLTQAYFLKDKKFHPPPWLHVLIRDVNDPLQLVENGTTGSINVIDLANLDSCSFIATADLGKVYPDGTFDVTGRMDQSDIRGCNLMWE